MHSTTTDRDAAERRPTDRSAAGGGVSAADSPADAYRLVFERNPSPMWVFDRQTLRFLAVNDAVVARYGYSREELLGMTVAELCAAVAGGAAGADPAGAASLAGAVSGGAALPEQPRRREHRTRDGVRLEVEIEGEDLEWGGRPARLEVVTDVTEWVGAERALRQAEEQLHLLAEAVPQALWIGASDTPAPVYVSPGFERIWGIPAEEAVANPYRWLDGVHPDDRERVVAAAMRNRDAAFEIEYRVVRPDGEVRWVRDRGFPARDGRGALLRVAGVAEDITERKRAELALRESEQRFRAIFEQARIGIALSSIDGRLVDCNRALAEMLGYSREELRQLHFSEVTVLADLPRELAMAGSLLRGERESYTLEKRYVRKDGEIVHAHLTVSLMSDADGTPVHVVVLVEDITERTRIEEALRASEERFRALIENASDTICIVGVDGRLLYTSPAVGRALGYGPEELRGRPVSDLVHPEEVAAVEAMLRRVAAEPGGVQSATYRIRHKDGSWRWFDGLASNRLEDPRVAGIVVNSRDVTERRRLEEELMQAQKMEAVGRLAGGIAHDFNNLLTGIQGYATLVRDGLRERDPLREDVRELLRIADRAGALTRQLLAFSRRQALQPRVLDLGGVVAGMEKMLRRLIGEDVQLTATAEPGLWPVRADPAQVEQLILNLAVNARDAMPGGGTLRIETRNARIEVAEPEACPGLPAGDYVLLEVRDSGEGIAPEHLPFIFEPFYTTKERGKGTGLGLATVYGVVKQSGGYIYAHSEPGRGASFRIYLPRVDGPVEPEPNEGGEVVRGGGEIVLVAEDEPAVRSLARRILERAGYRVLEAEDGEDALAVAEAHAGPIDLLLTDVVMPRMGGRTLAERLARARPGVRILFMSGYSEELVSARGPARYSPLLEKPFTPEALASRVRLTLDEAAPAFAVGATP
ncbi:MAG: PAS domain S-box protein [Gemmatimonadetes bacterium]|nr:PAS domain S-box protein [Gemmatimonadota bacterium]